ncbi:hypothetical protein [Paenibacillus sp. JCM 10914]
MQQVPERDLWEGNRAAGAQQVPERDLWERIRAAGVQQVPERDLLVYIVRDDWFRSADTRLFGTMTKDRIRGIVLGYAK